MNVREKEKPHRGGLYMSGGFGDDGFSGGGFDPDDSAQENVDKYYTYRQTSGGGGNGGGRGGNGRGISIGFIILILIVGLISNPVVTLAMVFFGVMAVSLIHDIRDGREAAKRKPNEDEQSTHRENEPE